MSTYEANRYAFPASAITSGTFANARLSSGSVTQHVDLSNLNASNLTSGTVPDARVGSSSVTQHVSAVTTASGTWTPSASSASFSIHNARYVRVGNLVHVSCWLFSNTSDPGYNTTPWTISGLPITSMSVSNITSHVVGWGEFYAVDNISSGVPAWVLPNSTIIRFGSGKGNASSSQMYPNSTSPASNSQGLSSVEGIMSNTNIRNALTNNNYFMALGLSYYV